MQSEGTGTYAKDEHKGVYTSEIRLELLKTVVEGGHQFRMRAPGFSMHPFIRNRDIITISPMPPESPIPGDVVAFVRPDTGKLVVHRVVKRSKDLCLIKGDNCGDPDGFIPQTSLLGIVTRVERNGRDVQAGLFYGRGMIAVLNRFGLLEKATSTTVQMRTYCGAGLQKLQGLEAYRRLAAHLRPSISFLEAEEHDMEEYHSTWNCDPANISYRHDPLVTNFVAKAGGKIVGFIQLVRHPESHYPYTGYWLFGLMVRVPYRGMGIGRELSMKVIEKADEEGAPELNLLVNEKNKAAISLYRQLKFEPVSIPGLEEQLDREYSETGSRRVPMKRVLGEGSR